MHQSREVNQGGKFPEERYQIQIKVRSERLGLLSGSSDKSRYVRRSSLLAVQVADILLLPYF